MASSFVSGFAESLFLASSRLSNFSAEVDLPLVLRMLFAFLFSPLSYFLASVSLRLPTPFVLQGRSSTPSAFSFSSSASRVVVTGLLAACVRGKDVCQLVVRRPFRKVVYHNVFGFFSQGRQQVVENQADYDRQ